MGRHHRFDSHSRKRVQPTSRGFPSSILNCSIAWATVMRSSKQDRPVAKSPIRRILRVGIKRATCLFCHTKNCIMCASFRLESFKPIAPYDQGCSPKVDVITFNLVFDDARRGRFSQVNGCSNTFFSIT